MKHVFGKTIRHRERFLIGDEVVLPSALVLAAIYEAEPTDAELDAGTGYISGSNITVWTRIKDEFEFAFPALTDSDAHSDTQYEIRYVAITFKYEDAAPNKYVVRPILVWRPNSMLSKIRVHAADVWAKEDRIRELRGPETHWTDGKITDAVNIVENKLRAAGYKRHRLADLEHLQLATGYLATALCCLDLAGEGNQFWLTKYNVYKGLFDSFFTESPVGYDIDDDGIAEPDEKTATTADQWVER